MSPVEIIFAGLGVLLLLVSCFVTGKKEESETALSQLSLELTEQQKQKLEEEIDHILEERTDHLVVKADDYMSKISNEKIMAVHDFTAQIMEKIDYNHQEVVFLYDMLNQKEAEIKETMQALEKEKKSLKESEGEAVHLAKQLEEMMRHWEAGMGQASSEGKASTKKSSSRKASQKKAPSEGLPEGAALEAAMIETQLSEKAGKASEKDMGEKKTARTRTKTAKQEKEVSLEEQAGIPEMMQTDNKSEEILKLHRQGKSVLEISKALGLGQGEVKLVIDLYGAAL